METAVADLNAEELMVAIKQGGVEVAELTPDETSTQSVASSVRAALGENDSAQTDRLVEAFTARVVETLADPTSFPLLDANASGLMRALEAESNDVSVASSARRGAEVGAATRFMGYLPYFDRLTMGATLDLRTELAEPLVRFRAAIVKLSRTLSSRHIDPEFEAEVADLWRSDVEPALLEIRDAFAARGLLREAASVIAGDPRRLLFEAGGAIALGATNIVSLPRIIAAATAGLLPIADVAARAAGRRMTAEHSARQSGMYFLHSLNDQARDRAT